MSAGLRASSHPGGRLARTWRRLLDHEEEYADRVARGRTLARAGKVRALRLSPGVVTAEVQDGRPCHPTVRLATLEPEDWDRVLAVLTARLDRLAALLEGDLPASLVEELETSGIRLVPAADALDGDCDCGDYAVPCSHVAAVHHVLADALDGDPFVLFTLRGRPREQLLVSLRRAWGDDGSLRHRVELDDEPAPDDDWYGAAEPIAAMSFHLSTPAHTGLAELGPLQGDDGLERALAPLLEAGREAALTLALAETDTRRRRRRRAAAPPPPVEIPVAEAPDDSSETTLTERLVDLLADADEGSKTRDLADALGLTVPDIRDELVSLEELGIVYRTGRTRGTRWWLG